MSHAQPAEGGRNRPALRLVETKSLSREDWLEVRKNGIGGSDAWTGQSFIDTHEPFNA